MFRCATWTAALAAMLLAAGCLSTPWVRGSVAEGLPKLSEKFPADTAFFVDRTELRVKKAFADALMARKFEVVEKREESDVVVKAEVTAWEFNDMGFGGRHGARDDMELAVSLVDRRTDRVLARANISIRSDFRIVARYVERF